jgi:hypothetical protein
MRYATDQGVTEAFWLAPQQDYLEELGVPLERPVFLAVVLQARHRIPPELRYGSADYCFVAGVDGGGHFSQTGPSGLNFALYRRSDVVCDAVLKARGLPIPIAPTLSFCLERLDFALPSPPTLAHLHCVALLMNKFGCVAMFTKLSRDPAFSECFFAGDLPVLSDRDLWARHAEAIRALARAHPSPATLAAALLPYLSRPESAPAAFALIHALPIPFSLLAGSIRAVLAAGLEPQIAQFDAAVLRAFANPGADGAMLREFPRLTRLLCNDAAFFPLFAGANAAVQRELLHHASPESLLAILAASGTPLFVLRAADRFPSDARFVALHAAVRPSPELAEQPDWVALNLAHPDPPVRHAARRLLIALFPRDAAPELLPQLQGAVRAAARQPYFVEVLVFVMRFPAAISDPAIKTFLIRILVVSDLDELFVHEEIFELAAGCPPVSLHLWEDCWPELTIPPITRRPLFAQQVAYLLYFFVESRVTGVVTEQVDCLITILGAAKLPASPIDKALDRIADSTNAENVHGRLSQLVLVPTMATAAFPRMVCRVLALPSVHESSLFVFAPTWLFTTNVDVRILPAVNGVLKRVQKGRHKSVAAQKERICVSYIQENIPYLVRLRGREPRVQVELLKLLKNLAFLFTPCLTWWFGKRSGEITLESLWKEINDVSAAREFSKFVTEIVREAIANPTITSESMVKRRIDVWVEAFTMTLAKPVKFAAVEKHLTFAMALSKCQKVRYGTGSFWFQILNRLVDWENIEFLKEYFVTILDNGVTLCDQDYLVDFIKNLIEDDTLDAKLEVLNVIVTKLEGSAVLAEVASCTLHVLDAVLMSGGIPERFGLFERFLLIAASKNEE